jgi:hypothetical protein
MSTDEVKLIQPVSMGPVMTEEELHALPTIPGDVLQLSLALGIDLTPEQDLGERLDAFTELAIEMQQRTRSMLDHVRTYEQSVKGHTPEEEPDL